MRSHRGQATVEYVAALALLVCIFVAAAVAVAAPGVPRAVVAKLKLALCTVGGDVCTAADAAARGLEPCLLTSEEHDDATGVSVLVFRAGGNDFWSVQRRSDGRVVLTEGYGQDLGATTGVGVALGPVSAGGSASGGIGFRSGRSWTMGERELEAALAKMKGNPTKFRLVLPALLGPPSSEYLEGGGSAGAELALDAVESVPGAGADVRAVLGRRKGAEGTSFYVDLGAGTAGPLTDVLPQADLAGAVSAEYRASRPPVLTLRGMRRGHSGEETEVVMRLPLRTAADVAAARRVAFVEPRDPGLALRDLAARIRDRGTVERLRYRTRKEGDDWSYGAKLGLELGVDHSASVLRRELIAAEVLGGPSPARREDCLPSG